MNNSEQAYTEQTVWGFYLEKKHYILIGSDIEKNILLSSEGVTTNSEKVENILQKRANSLVEKRPRAPFILYEKTDVPTKYINKILKLHKEGKTKKLKDKIADLELMLYLDYAGEQIEETKVVYGPPNPKFMEERVTC